jgi:dienelactone hydrolase/lysophospholipase L1-like esterase
MTCRRLSILLVCCTLAPTSLFAQAPAKSAKPPLPQVILLGDSIRTGYAPLVAKRLAGRAVVVNPDVGTGDSSSLLALLDRLVLPENPTIIHFNCGLHDIKVSKEKKVHQVELERYEKNLRAIVARLRAETKAQLVFANTTPIIDERHAKRKADFDRHEADVQKYNAVAVRVMNELGVPVNDLHWVVEQNGIDKTVGGDGTHYGKEGYERLAEAVADSVIRRWEESKAAARFVNPKADPDAGGRYRKNQAERDALVPEPYKKLKVGVLSLPETAAAWTKERPDVLRKVVASFGDMPPRPTPQRVRLVSRELLPGFTLERVAIDNGLESEVSALLVLPEKRQHPAPAILWLHSSTPDKNQLLRRNASGGDLSLAEAFAKAGYVVLAPDAYWYGDRAGTGPSGTAETYRGEPWLTPGELRDSFLKAQDAHFKLNLWLGRTLWGMMVRDDRVALDYLCSRPEVDKSRIGATGMSMGSTRAYWLAAVDERVTATVCVACLTRYENLIRHGQLKAHGTYFFSWGLLKDFDCEGVLSLIAPRPFLALTGDLDEGSPADGIKVLEDKVSRVYGVLDARDRFKSIVYPDIGHTYTSEMRTGMLAWFDRWLAPRGPK